MSKLQYRIYVAPATILGSPVGDGMAESIIWLRPACG